MARNAEKKAHETAAYWGFMLAIILAVINVLYVATILYMEFIQEDSSWSWWTFVWPVVYAYLEYKTYNWLIS